MQATKKTVQRESCAGLTQSCPATTDVAKRTTMCRFYGYLIFDLIESSLVTELHQMIKVWWCGRVVEAQCYEYLGSTCVGSNPVGSATNEKPIANSVVYTSKIGK